MEALSRSPLAALGPGVEWIGTAEDNRGLVLSNQTALVVVFRGTRLQVHSLLDLAEVVVLNQNDLWDDGQFLPSVRRPAVQGLRPGRQCSDR